MDNIGRKPLTPQRFSWPKNGAANHFVKIALIAIPSFESLGIEKAFITQG